MTKSEVFTISNNRHPQCGGHYTSTTSQYAPHNNGQSSNGGILKSGKVSTNPDGKAHRSCSDVQKKVRHSMSSQVSVDSTFDASDLEMPLPRRKRYQRRLSVILHTHVVLIAVCLLAALDAVCVIGQLICDILIMREKLDHFEKIDEELTAVLFHYIRGLNASIHDKWNLDAILDVLTGNDMHTDDGPVPTIDPSSRNLSSALSANSTSAMRSSGRPVVSLSEELQTLVTFLAQRGSHLTSGHHRVRRAAEPEVPGHEVDHGVLYDLTHFFHLASMVILSLLLLETLLKVFAMGSKLRHHKLEVFDALVVAISWSLDVAFYEGIWAHPGTTAATILIYLLPWRVVRIVNSVVLVIQEKDHVQLKIVKQRLRQSLKKSKECTEKVHSFRHEVKALAGLCRKLGASDSEINACSPSGKAVRRGSIHSVLERAASLTFISTMSSVGSLPSLFDMGDVSSEDEDSNNQHKALESSVSQAPTIHSDFSSSTLDSNSKVFMESESSGGMEHAGGEPPSSACSSPSSAGKKLTTGSPSAGGTPAKMVIGRTCSGDSGESGPPCYQSTLPDVENNTRL